MQLYCVMLFHSAVFEIAFLAIFCIEYPADNFLHFGIFSQFNGRCSNCGELLDYKFIESSSSSIKYTFIEIKVRVYKRRAHITEVNKLHSVKIK